MKRITLLLIAAATLAFAVSGLYAWLGGFKKLAITEVAAARPQYLAGQSFVGNARDARLDSLYRATRSLHTSGQLRGTLGALYYDDLPADQQRRGDIKAFVGVWLTDSLAALPPGYGLRTVSAQRLVQARIESHFLVAPQPGEVQTQLRAYAKARGWQPENFVIEKYFGDESIVLQLPLR